jgi:ferritin
MLSKKVLKALNEQITKEFYSAYLYYAMAAQCNALGLPGHSHWMKCQAQEELSHGARLFNYVAERDGRVVLEAIDKPPKEWAAPLAMFAHVCEHEAKVTASINDIVTLAREEKDHATDNELQWVVNEQVEEEAAAKGIRDQLKLVDSSGGGGLFMVDKDLAARVFVYPPPALAPGA